MKKLFKNLLDIPIPYAVVLAVVATGLIVLTVQGEITLQAAFGFSLLALVLGLQFFLGSVVIKGVFSAFIVLYMSSIYTGAVMAIHGEIVEPFLLTIAAVTIFLAQTYKKDRLNYGIRSRALWSSLLVFVLVSVKLAFTLSGFSFLLTEIIGLNVLVIYIAIWRFWLNNAKKTRMTFPKIEKEEVIEKFKFIHIESRLNARDSKWVGLPIDSKDENAYPYIYNEVLKANEEGLSLVFVNKLFADKLFDVEYVKVNKARNIPYMYIEDKNNEYMLDALEDFSEEVYRYNK